jgi:hypothetical protein
VLWRATSEWTRMPMLWPSLSNNVVICPHVYVPSIDKEL